ncbi:hypothetical protein MMC17_000164 [Xylographa soralifera]|nr:hypothetical protein [Xylographa soralifera]
MRSIKPSFLLNIYLLLSVLFDAVQIRTLFLLHDNTPTLAVFTTALGVKIVLLLLEARAKRFYLKTPYSSLSVESTIGIFNLSFFWWLNKTFARGFKTILTFNSLEKIDADLASENLGAALQKSWDTRSRPEGPRSLVFAVCRTFRWTLLLMIFPRLFFIGFNYAQPFLITSLLDLIGQPDDTTTQSKGYGLIGAAALIYIGIAVSNGLYKYQLFRFITMFRSAMITVIFDRTLSLQDGVYNESSAVSLMGTDTERICLSIEKVHEVWAQLFEVVIGIALLGRQLGWVCIWPLVVVAISTIGSSRVAKIIPGRQKVWAAAVQKRIAITASCISSMKSVRIMGLTKAMTSILQGQRVRELELMASFRWLSLWLNAIANIPSAFASAVTFVAFAVQAKVQGSGALNTTQAFTSLALIGLIAGPAARFLSAVPTLTASLGCFDRIQEYLLASSNEDGRQHQESDKSSAHDIHDSDEEKSTSIRFQKLGGGCPATLRPLAVSVDNADIRPSRDSTFLHKNINLAIRSGTVVIIAGPIGSGKTLLAKAILGEVKCEAGNIMVATKRIGYCSQVPWLPNSTIQQTICGTPDHNGAVDEKWYQSVLRACALEVDLRTLPDGDQTVIGSKGSVLSGGQRQRLSLARCVYARPDIVLLDDTLSALDSRTERAVIDQLLGNSGLLRQLDTTVILITHSVRHFSQADVVIILSPEGSILRQGPFEDVGLRDLDVLVRPPTQSSEDHSPVKPQSASKVTKVIPSKTNTDMARQTGDLSLYKYYAKFIGWYGVTIFLSFQAAHIFCVTFPQVWLMWWAEASGAQVAKYTTVYVAFSFLQLMVQGVAMWSVLVWIAPRSARKLHWVLLRTVMRARQSFFTETDTGITLNRFSQDMTLVEQALPQAAMMTIGMLFAILGQLSLLSLGSSYMAITIPFLFIAVYIIQFVYLRTSRQVRFLDLEAKSPIYSHFLETLDGIATVRAFGWQAQSRAINTSRLDASLSPYYLLYCIQRWLNLVLDLIVAGIAVLVIALAVSVRTSTSAGRLGVSLNSILGLSTYLSYLITAWTQLETSLGAIARIRSFERQISPEELPGEHQELPVDWPQHGQVEIQSVNASYSPASPALKNITMMIKPGQKVGICGRTGSGKSSLVSALLRLLDIESGAIIIDGIDLSCVSRDSLRERIVAIPQDPFVLTGTVRLNADPSSMVADEEIVDALTKVRLWSTLESRGGLDCDLNRDPLSHGQQQLFALARAMLRHSKLVILDEATSNVDMETDKLMQDTIREEFKKHTIIMIAHRLNTIVDADAVAVMEEGKLIEFDNPRVLLQQDSAFSRLHRA